MKNFCIVGTAGYVAPKHLKAIFDTGNNLLAAADLHDSVGILDHYFPNTVFFTTSEEFASFLRNANQNAGNQHVDYLSICSPNYMHFSHIKMALESGIDAICEKPLVISPKDLDMLLKLEEVTGHRVNAIVQARLHPVVQTLRNIVSQTGKVNTEVELTYITRRGDWYYKSWKGHQDLSGGIVFNIGIHMLDILLWIFGKVHEINIHYSTESCISGSFNLERAKIKWFTSLDHLDLPLEYQKQASNSLRYLSFRGENYQFDNGFTDLHTQAYKDILNGRGLSINDVRPSIELAYNISRSDVSLPTDISECHPFLVERIRQNRI